MTTIPPDFRALCAVLVDKLDELNCNFNIPSQSALIECANDALATPPPEPPTDEELLEFAEDTWIAYAKVSPNPQGRSWDIALSRAVLDRWGK
jgi:hypothetical protein